MNPPPTQIHMDCASRIKLERQKRSWTQEQLAERAQLSTRTVQRIECGAEVSPETLRLLADAFGVPPESLRTGKLRQHFGAPWGKLVKSVTLGVLGLWLVMVFAASFLPPPVGIFFVSGLPLVAIPSYFMSVSGFSIREGRLLVHRVGWAKEFDLAKLTGVEVNPHAMLGSIRLCGNGGLFCFIGWYRNTVIGRYRAYVTDTARGVVLEIGGEKIVVSPDDPEAFVESLRDAIRGVVKTGNTAPA